MDFRRGHPLKKCCQIVLLLLCYLYYYRVRTRVGYGSLVVKVMDSWPACYEFEPSTTVDPQCKWEMHVESIEAQISPIVMEVRRLVLVQMDVFVS
ncbi:hypothetical protein TNCV_4834421 [Trichonephila clavipes]|nr:hypothetical protein TNCV_4834421 [Trichonephila clavipes]